MSKEFLRLCIPALDELQQYHQGIIKLERVPVTDEGVIRSGVRGADYARADLFLAVGSDEMIVTGRQNGIPMPLQFEVLKFRDANQKDPVFTRILKTPMSSIGWQQNTGGAWVANTERLGINKPNRFADIVAKIAEKALELARQR